MTNRLPTTTHPAPFLVAEDDPDDRLFIRRAFERARVTNPLRMVGDGEELLDYLRRRGGYAAPAAAPRPGVILLDLNMPRKSGREALRELKADPALRHLPVVVLTTSSADEDVLLSYQAGASSFVSKPATIEGMAAVLVRLAEYWFGVVRLPAGEEC